MSIGKPFEIGDRVEYCNPESRYHGMAGVVNNDSHMVDLPYLVRFDSEGLLATVAGRLRPLLTPYRCQRCMAETEPRREPPVRCGCGSTGFVGVGD